MIQGIRLEFQKQTTFLGPWTHFRLTGHKERCISVILDSEKGAFQTPQTQHSVYFRYLRYKVKCISDTEGTKVGCISDIPHTM